MIARSNNNQGQFSFPDRNGNISVVLGFLGETLESYRYDAFGMPTFYNGYGTSIMESGISNALLYTGREWNQTFGLYEYRARGYDPKLGRFLSEDPKGFDAGDYNLYRYVGNDPLDRTDPMGLTDVPTTHEEDIAGRDASIGALNYARQQFQAGHDRTLQDYGQGVRDNLKPNGKFFKEKLTTTKVFQDSRLKTVQAKTERIETSDKHPVVGHVHHDVNGQPRSSSDASTQDLDAAQKGGKIYRVNESNPNVIYRAVPQVEGTSPVDRPFDKETMKPIVPEPVKQEKSR